LVREARVISEQIMQTDPAAEPPFDTSGLVPPASAPATQ
jgi:hypothetical protein